MIPIPQPIQDPIPELIPILDPIPETDSGPTIWNQFQETSELAEIDSEENFNDY